MIALPFFSFILFPSKSCVLVSDDYQFFFFIRTTKLSHQKTAKLNEGGWLKSSLQLFYFPNIFRVSWIFLRSFGYSLFFWLVNEFHCNEIKVFNFSSLYGTTFLLHYTSIYAMFTTLVKALFSAYPCMHGKIRRQLRSTLLRAQIQQIKYRRKEMFPRFSSFYSQTSEKKSLYREANTRWRCSPKNFNFCEQKTKCGSRFSVMFDPFLSRCFLLFSLFSDRKKIFLC